MTYIEFAETINNLPIPQQNAFFETLKNYLSEEDWLTTVKFISLHGMFHNPDKYTAMKDAVKDTLLEVIFGGI